MAFLTAFIRILGIIDNTTAILRSLLESAKPEERAALVARHESRIAKFERIGDWFEKRIDGLKDNDNPAPTTPPIPAKAVEK